MNSWTTRLISHPAFGPVLFLLLTLISGWLPAFWIWRSGWEIQWLLSGESALTLALLPLGPGIAALFTVALCHGHFRAPLGLDLGKPALFFPAWLLFPGLAALAAGVSVMLGWTNWDWNLTDVRYQLLLRLPDSSTPWLFNSQRFQGILLWLLALLFGPIFGFLPALAEELGWRGYLYTRFKTLGFWPVALIAGLAWWGWRLPFLVLGYPYPEHPFLGPLLGLAWGLGISVLLTWLRALSQGLGAVVIAQATLSSSAMMPLAVTQDFDPLLVHLQGIVGLVLLWIFILWGWVQGWLKTATASDQ